MPGLTSVRWIAAAAGAALVLLAIGIPTGLMVTPWYTRMTAPTWWSYPVWVATGVMSGLLIATYVRGPGAAAAPRRFGAVANVGSLLAVGCPVCNKLVVAAIGVSGALDVWAPLQPAIATLSLALLGWALHLRLRAARSCSLPRADVASAAPSSSAPSARIDNHGSSL